MESLIELVAASLARHGIECPDDASRPVWRQTVSQACPESNQSIQAAHSSALAAEPTSPTALPEHNYRKILDGDPAP
jgi:hypothetical protein